MTNLNPQVFADAATVLRFPLEHLQTVDAEFRRVFPRHTAAYVITDGIVEMRVHPPFTKEQYQQWNEVFDALRMRTGWAVLE